VPEDAAVLHPEGDIDHDEDVGEDGDGPQCVEDTLMGGS
jgi:hypothetical protein